MLPLPLEEVLPLQVAASAALTERPARSTSTLYPVFRHLGKLVAPIAISSAVGLFPLVLGLVHADLLALVAVLIVVITAGSVLQQYLAAYSHFPVHDIRFLLRL